MLVYMNVVLYRFVIVVIPILIFDLVSVNLSIEIGATGFRVLPILDDFS